VTPYAPAGEACLGRRIASTRTDSEEDSVKNRLVVAAAIVVLTPIGNLLAQEVQAPARPEKPQTKLESFLANRGTLLVKDFYELGRVGGMSLDAVVLTEPGQEERRVRGVRIEVTEYGRVERSSTSFLDLEEIEDLSKALSYMSELATKWAAVEKQEYTEVQFATKGDFRIGFFQRKRDQRAFASSGSIGMVSTFVGVSDLAKAKDLVDKAAALLKTK
jgi:hypothetical protein